MNVQQTVITVTIPGHVDLAELDAAVASVVSGAKIDVVHAVGRDDEQVQALAFAEAIAELPASQWQMLRILMMGSHSLSLSQGDANFSIRPDLIAASRRLKRLLGLADPIGMILVRKKEYFFDGGYRGISYSATKFGRIVLEKLKEIGS